MRGNQVLPRYVYQLGALACLWAILCSTPSWAISQAESQDIAAHTNHHGSNDDQDEAVRNAMMALMNLSALNIPGAFAKGYEAYGNYINSEKLDDLEARTKRLNGLMSSVDSQQMVKNFKDAQANAASKDSNVSGKVLTTLSTLDTGFLYKGQTAQVAEEFEKRSGMKREEFFQHLAAGTDAHYTYDDPELLGKLEQRWEAFKARIPNKEFREGVEKAEAMFPHDARVKMLGEAMAFYKDKWKSDGSHLAAAPATPAGADTGSAAAAPTPAATAPAAPAAVAESAAAGEQRAPASVNSEKDKEGFYPKKVGLYIGLESSQDPLKELIQSSGGAADDTSLFKMVSQHYRKLTPALVAQKNVGDAK